MDGLRRFHKNSDILNRARSIGKKLTISSAHHFSTSFFLKARQRLFLGSVLKVNRGMLKEETEIYTCELLLTPVCKGKRLQT